MVLRQDGEDERRGTRGEVVEEAGREGPEEECEEGGREDACQDGGNEEEGLFLRRVSIA